MMSASTGSRAPAGDWDLVIVGAGPAGSAAALGALSQRPDLKVLLLDRARDLFLNLLDYVGLDLLLDDFLDRLGDIRFDLLRDLSIQEIVERRVEELRRGRQPERERADHGNECRQPRRLYVKAPRVARRAGPTAVRHGSHPSIAHALDVMTVDRH